MTKISAIIPAAGSGKRMGSDVSKQYLSVGGRPLIAETLLVFQNSPLVNEIILVSPEMEMACAEEIAQDARISKVSRFVIGGKERQDSVRNGLAALDADTSIVIVHDGVRPFIDNEMLEEVIDSAKEHGAAIVAVPVKDTVKETVGGEIKRTVPREKLWLAQTPQAFRYDLIRKAFDNAEERGITGTDESSLVEALGEKVKIVMGSYHNIKITTPEDMVFAEAILKERME